MKAKDYCLHHSLSRPATNLKTGLIWFVVLELLVLIIAFIVSFLFGKFDFSIPFYYLCLLSSVLVYCFCLKKICVLSIEIYQHYAFHHIIKYQWNCWNGNNWDYFRSRHLGTNLVSRQCHTICGEKQTVKQRSLTYWFTQARENLPKKSKYFDFFGKFCIFAKKYSVWNEKLQKRFCNGNRLKNVCR